MNRFRFFDILFFMSETLTSSLSIPSWDEYSYRNDLQMPAEYADQISKVNEEANAKVAIWRVQLLVPKVKT